VPEVALASTGFVPSGLLYCSMMSISGGPSRPASGSSQNAGHSPMPLGSLARISNLPYICPNFVRVLMSPDCHGRPFGLCWRTALIEQRPSCTRMCWVERMKSATPK
jgi:hypothetical protein